LKKLYNRLIIVKKLFRSMINLKYVLLADLHGNYKALDQILNHKAVRAIDKFIIAGDLIGGAFPNKIIDRVRDLDALIVYGNSEEYLFRHLDNDTTFQSLQWAPIRHTFSVLSQSSIDFLTELPRKISIKIDGRSVLITHAVPDQPWEVFYPEKDMDRVQGILNGIKEDCFITGHSHIQWAYGRNNTYAVNPGSVAYPIGYSGKTDFAIADFKDSIKVDFYSLDFDIDDYIDELDSSGYFHKTGPLGKAYAHMMRSGKTVPSFFLKHVREKHNLQRDEIIKDEHINSGMETFEWEE
jgi:putative phosphoesterase